MILPGLLMRRGPVCRSSSRTGNSLGCGLKVIGDWLDRTVLEVIADAALFGVFRHRNTREVLASQPFYGRFEGRVLLSPTFTMTRFKDLVELHVRTEHTVLVLQVAPERDQGTG